MPYADFAFYREEFCGTQIDSEEDYLSAALKADCYLDWLTNGKTRRLTEIPREVKLAECAVSELYRVADDRQGIHSESNDGYQVVYEEPNEVNLYREAVRCLPKDFAYRGIGI